MCVFSWFSLCVQYYAGQVRKAIEDQKQKHNDTNMAENFKTEFSATERKKKEMYEKYEKKLTQTNHIIPVYVVKQELARSTLDTDQIMSEFEAHYATISQSQFQGGGVTLRKDGASGAMAVQPQEKKYAHHPIFLSLSFPIPPLSLSLSMSDVRRPGRTREKRPNDGKMLTFPSLSLLRARVCVCAVLCRYTLPQRFCDTSTWRHQPVRQHAVFTTTNSSYGLKPPSPQTMPSLFAGINGSFTSKFPGLYKSSGFTTARTTSQVHKSLDDF